MRPTENFLLFLPFGKGVEGGSGQFFSVLFCKTALAICILLPAPLSQKISRKSLARSRPLHPFRTAYRTLYAAVERHSFRLFCAMFMTGSAPVSRSFIRGETKKRNKKTEQCSVLQMFGCFVRRKPRRPTGAHFFLSESWSFSLTSSSISVRRVLMSLNWRCTEA